MLDSSAQQQAGGGKASSTAVHGGHGRASSYSLAGKKPQSTGMKDRSTAAATFEVPEGGAPMA